jgi:hypothetical protein
MSERLAADVELRSTAQVYACLGCSHEHQTQSIEHDPGEQEDNRVHEVVLGRDKEDQCSRMQQNAGHSAASPWLHVFVTPSLKGRLRCTAEHRQRALLVKLILGSVIELWS